MMSGWRSAICGGLLLATTASPAVAQTTPTPVAGQAAPTTDPAQTAAPTAGDAPSPAVPITTNDLARIRRSLDIDPAVRIDDDELRFYMQILAKQPTFAEFAKGYDFQYGPTRRGNPMSHDEFLSMVTPRELNSQIGINARETLEFALTNWLGQTLVKKAFADLRNAKTDREIQEIRDRIERELAQLRSVSEP